MSELILFEVFSLRVCLCHKTKITAVLISMSTWKTVDKSLLCQCLKICIFLSIILYEKLIKEDIEIVQIIFKSLSLLQRFFFTAVECLETEMLLVLLINSILTHISFITLFYSMRFQLSKPN